MLKQLQSLKKLWPPVVVKEAVVWPSVRVRYVKAVTHCTRGTKQCSLGITKLWNLSFKEIFGERGFMFHTARSRVRDTHRERWWINRGEKLSKRIQAESSCLDLTSPDRLCKTAQDGEQCACVRERSTEQAVVISKGPVKTASLHLL